MSNTTALSAEYARVIAAKFTTKRDGTPMLCMTCGTPLAMGAAFAATNGTGWHSYCERCAADSKAQIGGLVARIEAIVAPLGDKVPVDVLAAVMAVQPTVENLLDGTSTSNAVFLAAKIDLLAIRTMIGQAKAAGQPAPVRTNNYGGKCGKCAVWVEPQTGRIEKINGRWVTFHLDGACPTPAAATPQVDLALGLYLDTDGNVRKVYKTRNERLAVKVLVPQTTGEVNADGTPRLRGSFQYVTGGIRVLRDLLAAGKAHALTQDEAAAFGRQFSFCVNCGLYLDDDRSLAAGYGPTCAENNRWFYPTYTEASAILGRPAGPNTSKVAVASNPRFEEQAAAEAAATPTAVCEYCEETVRLGSLDLWVDGTGSEVCSGDDASGPDFHHQPITG